jgi:hypothetical protein
VIVSAKSEGKKVEAHWTFGIDAAAAGATAPPAGKTRPTPQKRAGSNAPRSMVRVAAKPD